MNAIRSYLSFTGRIHRNAYCLRYMLPTLIIGWMLDTFFDVNPVVDWVLSLIISYVAVVGVVKRFHDCGRSGWWVCIMLPPWLLSLLAINIGLLLWLIVISLAIWPLSYAAFAKGTVGPNKYGEDPIKK